MLITAQGMVNRTHVNEIRVVGRNTQGVRIMGVGEGDKIASIAKIAHDEMEAAGEPIATRRVEVVDNYRTREGVRAISRWRRLCRAL